ncbi:hypothetical protein [Weissella viridescens]|uniref:hypothetical protein n=1 Tax=Weissella viridescens TaxID=1629 RepID=UPI003AA877C2
MILIKLEPEERKELKKHVDYLERHGDENNRTLSKSMIAYRMHISAPTLVKALKTDTELKPETYDRIKEWLAK